MTDRISNYQTGPATTFYLECDRVGQDQAGNFTRLHIYLRAVCGPGGATSSQFNNYGAHIAVIDGIGEVGRKDGTPFMPSGYPNGAQRWRVGPFQVDIGHGADGRRGGITLRMQTRYSGHDVDTTAWFDDFPRIPKLPAAPTPLGISNVTSSGFRYQFSGNDDGGSGMLEWQAQTATNSSYSANVVTMSSSGTTDFTGLLPGNTYWARSRGRNAVGWGPWSGDLSTYVGLPAPTINTFSQNGTGGLVATWSAPSSTTGLTGYRVQLATNSTFTENVTNHDFGNVLTGTITGKAGGRVYYAKVAALTAGGVNAYSSSLNHLLVLDAGDLDGWSRVGTKPANISYYTVEGIRRGTVGTAQALYLESLATGSATLAINTFGMQKTITGLTVGKSYRFEAHATKSGTPLADSYKLNVVSESSGTATDVTSNTSLGYIEFVADATSATLQILLSEAISVPGASNSVENVAFHAIKLLELDTDFPQRLRGTVYESNLANHFDLACNSVGATWLVDKAGITRFLLPGNSLPVSAVFSDEVDALSVSYVDIVAGFDTRSTVNRIEATNYGVDATGNVEENDELIVQDIDSQATYGVFRSTLQVNLYDEAPYDESFSDRLTELLEAHSVPEPLVTQIRWNAQESLPLATSLEVGQRINVRYRGLDYDSQIVAITHDITPTRWMVTLDLNPL